MRFFMRRKNYRGSAAFLGGVLLVIWGWTFVGAWSRQYLPSQPLLHGGGLGKGCGRAHTIDNIYC